MNSALVTVCEHSVEALFAGVWHGALLLAVVALALRLLPRQTAAARSLIWTVALLLIAALPLVSVPSAQSFERAIDPSRVLHLNPAWSLAIAAVWLASSLFRAGQLALSASRLRAISANAEQIEGVPPASVRTIFGFHRSATLCLSDEVSRPSVIGFFSPRILIPRDLYPRLSAGEIDHIVLHEMEHLRRGDDWRNLLQKLAVTLFPLNPALLWIERRLCFERELACDESVLAHTHAPKSYAACLVHLAEERSLGRQISLALGAWERRSELGRRVHGILANAAPASVRIRTACASFVTAGMVASALLLAKTPQLISFSTAAAPALASAAPFGPPAQNVIFRPTGVYKPGSAAQPRANQPSANQPSPNQPRMVDAMMRVPSLAAAPVKIKRTPVHKPRIQQVAYESAAPMPAPQPQVVLASWTYTDGISVVRVQRVLYAVYELPARAQSSSSPDFSNQTAQPMPGGLFILQL